MYKIKVTGTKELLNDLKAMSDSFGSKEMMDYLGDKCERTLYKITHENLTTVDDLEVSDYAKNHQKEILKNKIILSNNTMADLSGLSPETLANYPNGFSIARAVEYGTGIVGASSAAAGEAGKAGWEYDINQHGDKGWFYVKDGKLYWSRGFEGRLIYYKTHKDIADNIKGWIYDYVDNKEK